MEGVLTNYRNELKSIVLSDLFDDGILTFLLTIDGKREGASVLQLMEIILNNIEKEDYEQAELVGKELEEISWEQVREVKQLLMSATCGPLELSRCPLAFRLSCWCHWSSFRLAFSSSHSFCLGFCWHVRRTKCPNGT